MPDEPKPENRFREAAIPSPWEDAGEPHRLTPMPQTTIYTVDYAAGSRKTRSAIPWAIQRAALHNERYLLAFPTRITVEQNIELAKEMGEKYGVDVRAVLSLEREEEDAISARSASPLGVKSAVKTLMRWMGLTPILEEGEPEDLPSVILCTHRAMRLLDPRRPIEWHVIQDEVFDPMEAPPLTLSDNIGQLTSRFSLWSGVLDGYYYLHERALTPFHALSRVQQLQDNDDIHKMIMKVVEPYQAGAAIFVPRGVWDRTVRLENSNPDTDPDPEPKTKKGDLHLAVLHTPRFCTMFASYTIMSAALTDSLLYKAWSHRYSINWISHDHIHGEYETHDMAGRRVEIMYLNEHLLTKSQRDQWESRYRETHPHSPPKTLIQAVIEIAEKAFDMGDVQAIEESSRKASYLFVANRDVRERDLPPNRLRLRMPNVAHGMNTWRNVNQVLFFSALNPNTMTVRFMRHACMMTPEEIQACWNYLTAYQAAARSSMRNDSLTEEHKARPLRIIVPDRGTALWLSKWFTNCEGGGTPEVRRIGDLAWDPPGEAGRPRVGQNPLSIAERSRRYEDSLSPEEKAARRAKKAEAARVRRARERDEKNKTGSSSIDKHSDKDKS